MSEMVKSFRAALHRLVIGDVRQKRQALLQAVEAEMHRLRDNEVMQRVTCRPVYLETYCLGMTTCSLANVTGLVVIANENLHLTLHERGIDKDRKPWNGNSFFSTRDPVDACRRLGEKVAEMLLQAPGSRELMLAMAREIDRTLDAEGKVA